MVVVVVVVVNASVHADRPQCVYPPKMVPRYRKHLSVSEANNKKRRKEINDQ